MNPQHWLLAVVIAVAPSSVMALSGVESLEGSVIVASGNIEPITCPISGTHDCLNWPDDQYRMPVQGICFTADVSCGYSCEGFIAEKDGARSVYVFSSVIGPRISKSDIETLKCPTEE